MDRSRFRLSLSKDAFQERATIKMLDRHWWYGQYMKWTVDLSPVPQLFHGRGQTPAILSRAPSLSQLTEQPGRKMIPGSESLAVSYSTMFLDQVMELPLTE